MHHNLTVLRIRTLNCDLCPTKLVELEASNSVLEDDNTRLEAAVQRAAQEAAQLQGDAEPLRAALEAKDHQMASLKVHHCFQIAH